jgi:hypothetical protein
MPYIDSKTDRREKLQKGEPALSAGELNYQIFYYIKHQAADSFKTERFYYVIKGFVDSFLGEKPTYQRYNDMTGALVRCYAEIKRRLNMDTEVLLEVLESYNKQIDDYEDTKIISNGDVE